MRFASKDGVSAGKGPEGAGPLARHESDLDRVVHMACKVFGVETALVCTLDEHRWYLAAAQGLDPWATPWNDPFCAWAFRHDGVLVLPDVVGDERVRAHFSGRGNPRVGFYAGRALCDTDGRRIGTFAILSSEPRGYFTENNMDIFVDLARLAEAILRKRELGDCQATLIAALSEKERELLVDAPSGVWNHLGLERMFERESARAARQGIPLAVVLLSVAKADGGNPSSGDDYVAKTPGILGNVLRGTDVVGRYGANSFLLILTGVYPALAPVVCDKLIRMFRTSENQNILGYDSPMELNAGVAVAFPGRTLSVSMASLLEAAAAALDAAKANGGNRYEISGMSDSLLASLALA